MAELTESRMRHLELIQRVIERMETNSFALKAISGTITAAVIAYSSAAEVSPMVVLAGIGPVLVFWLMDAQYLRLERLFRMHFDSVRGDRPSEPFDMNYQRHGKKAPNTLRLAFSWSTLWFYLTLIAVLVLTAFVT